MFHSNSVFWTKQCHVTGKKDINEFKGTRTTPSASSSVRRAPRERSVLPAAFHRKTFCRFKLAADFARGAWRIDWLVLAAHWVISNNFKKVFKLVCFFRKSEQLNRIFKLLNSRLSQELKVIGECYKVSCFNFSWLFIICSKSALEWSTRSYRDRRVHCPWMECWKSEKCESVLKIWMKNRVI